MRRILVRHEQNNGPILVGVMASGLHRSVAIIMNVPNADPADEMFRLVLSSADARELADNLFAAADAVDYRSRGT